MFYQYILKLGAADDSGNPEIIGFENRIYQNPDNQPMPGENEIMAGTGGVLKNLSDFCLILNVSDKVSYDIENSEIIAYDYTAAELKGRQTKTVKSSFLTDIILTDDDFLWFKKLVDVETPTTEETDKFNARLLYWQEGWTEYEIKKAAIAAEAVKGNIQGHVYNPTHS